MVSEQYVTYSCHSKILIDRLEMAVPYLYKV